MTTTTEATTTGDAQKSEGRPTDPGLGVVTAVNEEPRPEKQFDPRRYQANTVPPGFRSVIVGTKLPSMPKDRIAETLPPGDSSDAMGAATAQPVAGVAQAATLASSNRAEAVTAVEIPGPLPSVVIRQVTTAPKPTLPALRFRGTFPKPSSDSPVAVRVQSQGVAPSGAIPYRLAIPLAILIFAAGALVVLVLTRRDGQSTAVKAAEPTSATTAAAPVAPRITVVSPTVQPQATATSERAPVASAAREVEPARATVKRQPKAQPKAQAPESDLSKPRVRNEEPD